MTRKVTHMSIEGGVLFFEDGTEGSHCQGHSEDVEIAGLDDLVADMLNDLSGDNDGG